MLPIIEEAISIVNVFSFSSKRKIHLSKEEIKTNERKNGAKIWERATNIIVAFCSFVSFNIFSPIRSIILERLTEAAEKASIRVKKTYAIGE